MNTKQIIEHKIIIIKKTIGYKIYVGTDMTANNVTQRHVFWLISVTNNGCGCRC